MTRNRFDMLLRCLHFSDNSVPKAKNDRLFKIRDIIELCCKQFQETLEPGEELVIDESMVPWRGRLISKHTCAGRYEVIGRNKDDIRVTKWVDKRPVMMISYVPSHSDHLVAPGTKNKGNDVVKPSAVIAYNRAKKGVDKVCEPIIAMFLILPSP
ncbi:hypothetical protein NQ315_011183 [Exocentrus adspersus]|uniref:PiggyBac transposable element-derived protein domain-containing protein n=1 Tax=Exocentrus adspersus TaxID=1586481 RepID=A0AAV8V8X6_9CUCU|nr:hypothetical protein NQ315_011183 [Exocentrus adspersus]